MDFVRRKLLLVTIGTKWVKTVLHKGKVKGLAPVVQNVSSTI